MADAVELAAAYVSLVPSFEGAQGKITKELVPDLERAGDKAGQGFSSKFSGVLGSGAFQAGMAGAGLAVGAALVGGFVSAVEAGDAEAKTAAQLGLDPAEAARAGDVAGSVYAGAYGASLTEVNESVGAVMSSIGGMRQASAADLQDITQKALNLSEAFEVGVGEASTTAGVLLKNGLVGDADAAMDLITAGMQRVPASVRGEILPVMDEYSKHFAGLGIDGETAMGMIVAASADGAIGMDKMGDSLKEFTIRSTDMSAATSGAYESLGLNTEDMTRRLLAGGDSANEAMGEIVGALQSVDDPAAQSAAALALFGTPLEDLGTDQIPGFLAAIDPAAGKFESTAGAADAFGATLNSGPGVALEGLKRSVETAFLSFAETAMPAITGFTGWLSENSWVIGVFAGLVGVGLVAGFVALAASVWAANAAFWASPTTWIVLGIVAVVAALALLIANWDSVAAFLSGVWAGVVDFAVGLWDGLASFFSGWISSVSAWFNSGISRLGSWLSGMWSGIVSGAVGIWNGFLGFVGSIPGRILGGLAYLGALGGIAAGWFGGMVSAAVGKAGELVGWVAGIPGRVLGALGNLGGLLLNAGGQIMDGFLQGLRNAWGKVTDFVGGIGQWIADNKGPKAYDLALLVPAGGWIMEGLGRGLMDSLPDLRRTLGRVSETVAGGLGRSRMSAEIAAMGRSAAVGLAPAAGGGPTVVYVENPWGAGYLEGKVRGVVDQGIGNANADLGRRRPGIRG